MASTITLVSASMTDVHNQKKENKFKTMNMIERLSYLKELITIEPLLCCYFVAEVVWEPSITNLQLEMACRVNAGFNVTVCESVVSATHAEHNFTKQNSVVQQYVSDMLSWSIPVQSVILVILLLFFGSYSDRHKIRKPFLLLPVLGQIVGVLSCIVCVMFKQQWPVNAIGIAGIGVCIFGGSPMITMSAYAYVADISTQEMRIIRMAIIQICLSVCIPITMPFTGMLFDAVGYIPTLLLALSVYVLGFLYAFFLVKESKQPDKVTSVKDLIRDIFHPHHAIDTIKLLTNSRGSERINMIFILVSVYICATVTGGEYYVFFYFVQHAYGWDYSHYTIFLTVWIVINSIGLVVGAFVLSKVFHLQDLIIIAISFVGKIVCNIIFITIRTTWGLYLGLLAGILQDAGNAGIRSISTKYVSEDEIGKSQSLLSIAEAIAFALAAEIYHQGIYTYTRDTYIEAFFYVGIVLYTFGTAIVIWKYLSEKNEAAKEKQPNQNGVELKKNGSDITMYM